MPVITASTPQPPPQRRQATLPSSAAAILSASLLGLGLAWVACALLVPAVGREANSAFFPADRSQAVICSSGSSSTSPQTARADD